VAPQDTGAIGVRFNETMALLAILRSIAQDPRISSYSTIAFNGDQQKVLYRRGNDPSIDLPALSSVITQLKLGTVGIQTLRERVESQRFLEQIIAEGMDATNNVPAAVILVGPRINGDVVISDSLKELSRRNCPAFYLTYDVAPEIHPWRDSIGATVKMLRGSEYTITRPRDVFTAWTALMNRILKQPSNAASRTATTFDLRGK